MDESAHHPSQRNLKAKNQNNGWYRQSIDGTTRFSLMTIHVTPVSKRVTPLRAVTANSSNNLFFIVFI
jgi:hypothetical protein